MESHDENVQEVIYHKRLVKMFSKIQPGSDRVFNNAYKFHQGALDSIIKHWFPAHPEYTVVYTRGPIEQKVGKKKIEKKEGYVILHVSRAAIPDSDEDDDTDQRKKTPKKSKKRERQKK